MTFNIKDLNIGLKTFGSAPIRLEGQAVKYDLEQDIHEHEKEVDFGEDNVVEVNDAD